MKKLTARQQLVYDYISEYLQDNGMPPTVREIAEGLGFKSPNSVQEHLKLIEKKGFIELRRGIARGIFPIKDKATPKRDDNVNYLPLIGSVAAGIPITAQENITSSIAIDADLFGGDNLFTFQVDGDSMIEAGIHNGDFVIVNKQQDARDNDIVIALIDGDTTLKRYFKKSDHIVLQPENKYYKDIYVSPEQSFSIAGKMVGLIRKF